jgi:SAM-dependent methyltransferase
MNRDPLSGAGERARFARALDRYSEIYDRWVESAPVCARHADFYVPLYRECAGTAVELGVGNGRLIIEAARRGKEMTGVDLSPAMLALCRRRAEEAGVSALLDLIEGDFRDFRLRTPAALVTIPFHSLGHLETRDDQRAALRHIRTQLAPGGRLVLDHFVLDRTLAEKNDGVQNLRDIRREPDGALSVLWVASRFDFVAQRIRVIATEEVAGADGVVRERRLLELGLAWIDPAELRALLEETGYEVEALFGGFDRSPFDEASRTQVWVARRR